MATVSLVLFIAVAVSSVRLARRKLSYESWYGIHLYAYLAIALASPTSWSSGRTSWTTLSPGSTGWACMSRPSARCWCSGSAGRSVVNIRHRFRVVNVVA